MSDSWIQFVPADPTWQPSQVAADRAAAELRQIAPKADEVNATFHETVEFFDPGANWSGVKCPKCAADLEEWWGSAMSRAHKHSFSDLTVVTPCCSSETSLNDLDYEWPAAFGRFVLEAMNPNIGNTTPEQDETLEKALGAPLRKVLVHI
jgi:hypothetical protein